MLPAGELYPGAAGKALRRGCQDYRNPEMGPGGPVMDLMRAGPGRAAAVAKENIDFLQETGPE